MKKMYKTVLFALLANAAFGQSQFFTPTTYRGAFAPAPTAAWTDGWTNWDPQNTNYNPTNKPVVEITASITANTTWSSSKVYLLKGTIFVKNGATLTIPAGTVVMGDKATAGSGLFITKGSKLIANGTKTSPIVFTSNQAAGSRSQGDWGGIILLGKAKNNIVGGVGNIEGLAVSADTEFGGTDDADNSGSLKYVRIEFPGYVYQPNKEINGLTLGSVGSGTVLENIQVSFSNDDSFEWFGGTVNAKYLIAYRGLDDDFDTDNGFSGNVQFGLGVRDPQIADNPSVSTSEGFESDNDATGSTNSPQTSARFSNMTMVGPLRGNASASVASGYRRGARIRRNSALKIYNSVFTDYKNGLHIDGALSEGNATGGSLVFKNNVIAGHATTGKMGEVNSGSSFGINAFIANNSNDTITSTSGILTTPYDFTSPDYRPATSSIALTNSNFVDGTITSLVKTLATTKLKDNQCNTTVAALNTNIFANTVVGASGYKFKVTNGSEVQELVRTSSAFSLYLLSNKSYSTTYSVQVAPIYAGIVQAYGDACTITSPTPITAVKDAQCETSLATMTSYVYANPVLLAQGYKFAIANGSHHDTLEATSSVLSFAKFTNALSRQYATTYDVKVAVKTGNVWSDFGSACPITTPALPVAAISAASCGATVNLTTLINADIFVGASRYKFILTNGAHTDSVIQVSRSLRMSSFKNALSKVNGTTYSLKVAAEYNGTFGSFSTPCDITLNTAATINQVVNNDEVLAYPNPFTNDFKIGFVAQSEAPVQVTITDISGKVVENKTVNAHDFENMSFGKDVVPGLYNVSVQQDGFNNNFKAFKAEK